MFETYEEAQRWIEKKSKEYGGRNRFFSSEEYKKHYRQIQKLHAKESEPYKKRAMEAMSEAGVKPGDKVLYDVVSPYGFVCEAKGKIVMRRGIPYVVLTKDSASTFGRKSTKWHKGFRKA